MKGKRHRDTRSRHPTNRDDPIAPVAGDSAEMMSGGLRPWQPLWDDFLHMHQGWGTRLPTGEPALWLPEVIVSALAVDVSASVRKMALRPVITKSEVEAERAFRACCQGFSTSVIGVWHGQPVRYELLRTLEGLPSTGQSITELGWDQLVGQHAIEATLGQATRKADEARHQLLAYAGWLTFQPTFKNELHSLRRLWGDLEVKPPWPLWANTVDRQPIPVLESTNPSSKELPGKTVIFLVESNRFMRKWCLAQLATWDLIVPQGPLEQMPSALTRHLLGPDHIGFSVPAYYDIPSRQNLVGELRESQAAAAEDSGVEAMFPLTDLSARAGKSSQWENALRCCLIERTALDRYGGRRGLSYRLVTSLAAMLQCSVDRVKQLRQIYRPFLQPSQTA